MHSQSLAFNSNSFTSFLNDDEIVHQDINSESNQHPFKNTVWYNLQSRSNNNNRRNGKSEFPTKRWGHSSLIHNKSMLIFGGRHSHRSLVNIYSLDFVTFTWSKLEALGQMPPARDSHSAIVYKNEIVTFGGSGSGKKLNDLWTFNIESKKWSKLAYTGEPPCPREGHSSSLIRNTYMMIYGGLDENDHNVSDIFLLDLRNNHWHKSTSEGTEPSLRDSQSCTQINNSCYIFGGQGEHEVLYNDLYVLNFDINETEKKFKSKWVLEDVRGKRPPARTSHSACAYKSMYLFIVGGEGYDVNGENLKEAMNENNTNKSPLNDVWVYSLNNKSWSEVLVKNSNFFESRMCHSANLYSDKIYVYGGMKNADTTFDNLIALCLDGITDDLEESNYFNKLSCK